MQNPFPPVAQLLSELKCANTVQKAIDFFRKFKHQSCEFEYISFWQFIEDIKSVTKDNPIVDFLVNNYKELKQQDASSGMQVKYVVPTVSRNQNKSFYRFKLAAFIQQYLRESLNDKKPRKQQSKEQDYCYEFDLESTNLSKLISKERAIVPQIKSSNSSKGHQQLEEKDEQGLEVKIPWFFEYYYSTAQLQLVKRCSPQRLLSIDLTQYFEKQLQEVTQNIIKQTSQPKSFLVDNYQIFLKKYQEFDLIRKGTCEKYEQQQVQKFKLMLANYQQLYLKEDYLKIHLLYPNSKSFLMTYWETIFKQAQQQMKQKVFSKDKIREEIHNLLQNVSIYYVPGLQSYQQLTSYAQFFEDQIYIGCNHIPSSYSIQTFLQKLFKPYLFLCLIHEISHALLRRLKIIKPVNEASSRSLQLKPDKIGSCILQFMNKMEFKVDAIFNSFRITTLSSQQYEFNVKKVLNKMQMVSLFYKQRSSFFQKLRKNWEWKLIKQILESFELIIKEKDAIHNLIDWPELFNIILQAPSFPKIKDRYEKISQCFWLKDSLMFALFMGQQYLKLLGHSQNQLYKKAKSKLLNQAIDFDKIKDKLYGLYYKVQVHKDFGSDKHSAFSQLFYQEENPLQHLTSLMQNFYNQSSDFINSNFSQSPFYQKKYCFETYDLPYFPPAVLTNMGLALNFIHTCSNMMKFMKFSEVYLIACQMPDFFLLHSIIREDSGYFVEYSFFPGLKQSPFIYQQDYNHFKELNSNGSKLIGRPTTGSGNDQVRMKINKTVGQYRADGFRLRRHQCNNRYTKGEALKDVKTIKLDYQPKVRFLSSQNRQEL